MIRMGVVDDDPMVRTGLKLVLGGEDDLVVAWEAAEGGEALRRVVEDPVDVLLLDVRMPGVDGLGVLEGLGAQRTHARVLVLTTFNTDDYVVRALRMGAAGFVLKDAAPDQLIEAIHRVDAGEPVLSPQVTRTLIGVATAGSSSSLVARESVAGLTAREREVAELMAVGLTNGQIAVRLFISPASVKAHLSHIFTKLGVDNRVAAAMIIRDARG